MYSPPRTRLTTARSGRHNARPRRRRDDRNDDTIVQGSTFNGQNTSNTSDAAIQVEEDDLCPICQMLLCRPVTTDCGHVLCKSCLSTWIEASSTFMPSTLIRVDEPVCSDDQSVALEARCPMCRTQTTAVADENRERVLRSRYSQEYSKREDEDARDDQARGSAQPMTLYIGNTHQLVIPESEDRNAHDWTFFVRPSRTDIIEEVQILLHPTFRPNQVIRARPPFEVRRLGWGWFTVEAAVLLKAGYRWASSDAEDTPDGAPQGLLRFEWALNFSSFGGTGAMCRYLVKVKHDREWENVDAEVTNDTDWRRAVRTYEQDGRYEPSED